MASRGRRTNGASTGREGVGGRSGSEGVRGEGQEVESAGWLDGVPAQPWLRGAPSAHTLRSGSAGDRPERRSIRQRKPTEAYGKACGRLGRFVRCVAATFAPGAGGGATCGAFLMVGAFVRAAAPSGCLAWRLGSPPAPAGASYRWLRCATANAPRHRSSAPLTPVNLNSSDKLASDAITDAPASVAVALLVGLPC